MRPSEARSTLHVPQPACLTDACPSTQSAEPFSRGRGQIYLVAHNPRKLCKAILLVILSYRNYIYMSFSSFAANESAAPGLPPGKRPSGDAQSCPREGGLSRWTTGTVRRGIHIPVNEISDHIWCARERKITKKKERAIVRRSTLKRLVMAHGKHRRKKNWERISQWISILPANDGPDSIIICPALSSRLLR